MKKSIKLMLIAFGCMFLITAIVKAQETQPAVLPAVSLGENVTMKIGGFLRADAFFDTRKSEELVDGLFNFYPLNESLDANGKDLNELQQFRMAATASRLNSKFTGPDVLNAKTTAMVEFDFTGVNGYGLRLRHAWVKLNWEKSEVLFGRFWHPMFVLEAIPSVVALSTGAPFTVFNRCEQLRYTFTAGNLSFFAAASAQMKYGFPTDAAHTIIPSASQIQSIPDLTGNVQFKNDAITLGASGHFKINQPALTYKAGVIPKTYSTDEKVSSVAAMFYAKVKVSDLQIKGSVLYGQNMHELLLLGGYAVEKADTLGNIKYTTSNTMNYWCNIVYGKALQASVFVGYMQNLGTSSKTYSGALIGRGGNIDNLIRIAPCISYKTGRLLLQAELEHNIAAYGTPDPLDNAKVNGTKSVSNTRLQIASTFYF